MTRIAMIRAVTCFLAVTLAIAPNGPLEPLGRFRDPELREVSGIVQSRRDPDIFWVHNDSGNPPALFAVRRDGTVVRRVGLSVANVDWEDLAADNAGHLFVGDIGNNGGNLPLRVIYQLVEPDLTKTTPKPPKIDAASYYRFPPGSRFDAEGLFIDGKAAVLIAKTSDGREAELFEIPIDPPSPLLRPATPRRLGSLPGFRESVTGSDLSPDGKWLAVCGSDVARVYNRTDRGGWTLLGEVHFQADGIESIAWDGRHLILAEEGQRLYRIPERDWRANGGVSRSKTRENP